MNDLVMSWLGAGVTGILGFVAVFSLVIFVHELGHFWVARWLGFKIERFSVGLGPELYAYIDRHGTCWRIALLPIGGYVKFVGDAEPSGTAASAPHGREADGGAGDAEGASDPPQTFESHSVGARALVVAAGPFANFLFSIFVFATQAWFIGSTELSSEVSPSPGPYRLAQGGVMEQGPAERAGVQSGDRIVTLGEEPIRTFNDIVAFMQSAPDDEIDVGVERGTERLSLVVRPIQTLYADGTVDPVPKLGLVPTGSLLPLDERRRAGFLLGLDIGLNRVVRIITVNLNYVGEIFAGRESGEELAGIIGIGTSVYKAANSGLTELIMMMGFLSTAIGLINLFPIPVLDGGHLVFYAYEALAGRKPSDRVQNAAFWIGICLIASLFLFATFNDLMRLFGLGG